MYDKQEHFIPVLYVIVPFILQCLAWIPSRLFFFIFFRFKVTGLEHLERIDKTGGVIFAGNHASELDPIVLRAALPPFSRLAPLFYAANEPHLFKQEKFGWRSSLYSSRIFFKLWGAYSVYTGLYDFEKSLVNHIALLRRGHTLAYFPEGKITKDGLLQEGKPGVIYLAHTTSAAVVPVAISGTYGITCNTLLRRKHRVSVIFGEPLSLPAVTTHSSIDDYKKNAATLMEAIQKLLE